METFHLHVLSLETDTRSLNDISLAHTDTEPTQMQGKGTQLCPIPHISMREVSKKNYYHLQLIPVYVFF